VNTRWLAISVALGNLLEKGVHDRVGAADVEHRLVLAGEGRVAGVLADGRRPHRYTRGGLAHATGEMA
jgi:hypothetical protein